MRRESANAHAARAQPSSSARTSSSCQWPTTILRLQAQARADEPELPVAVRRLVQVHEVHVDLGPGKLAIELGMQVGQRLLEAREPGDPHLRRREGVHPGDHAGAGRRRLASRHISGSRRDGSASAWRPRGRGSCKRSSESAITRECSATLLQRLVAVKVLAAGEKRETRSCGVRSFENLALCSRQGSQLARRRTSPARDIRYKARRPGATPDRGGRSVRSPPTSRAARRDTVG